MGPALTDLSIQELENIQKTEANSFKRKTQMFRLWTALVEIDKTELASELRSHHCDDELVSSGYASVESSISSVLWNKGSEENETDGLKHDLPNLVKE